MCISILRSLAGAQSEWEEFQPDNRTTHCCGKLMADVTKDSFGRPRRVYGNLYVHIVMPVWLASHRKIYNVRKLDGHGLGRD